MLAARSSATIGTAAASSAATVLILWPSCAPLQREIGFIGKLYLSHWYFSPKHSCLMEHLKNAYPRRCRFGFCNPRRSQRQRQQPPHLPPLCQLQTVHINKGQANRWVVLQSQPFSTQHHLSRNRQKHQKKTKPVYFNSTKMYKYLNVQQRVPGCHLITVTTFKMCNSLSTVYLCKLKSILALIQERC